MAEGKIPDGEKPASDAPEQDAGTEGGSPRDLHLARNKPDVTADAQLDGAESRDDLIDMLGGLLDKIGDLETHISTPEPSRSGLRADRRPANSPSRAESVATRRADSIRSRLRPTRVSEDGSEEPVSGARGTSAIESYGMPDWRADISSEAPEPRAEDNRDDDTPVLTALRTESGPPLAAKQRRIKAQRVPDWATEGYYAEDPQVAPETADSESDPIFGIARIDADGEPSEPAGSPPSPKPLSARAPASPKSLGERAESEGLPDDRPRGRPVATRIEALDRPRKGPGFFGRLFGRKEEYDEEEDYAQVTGGIPVRLDPVKGAEPEIEAPAPEIAYEPEPAYDPLDFPQGPLQQDDPNDKPGPFEDSTIPTAGSLDREEEDAAGAAPELHEPAEDDRQDDAQTDGESKSVDAMAAALEAAMANPDAFAGTGEAETDDGPPLIETPDALKPDAMKAEAVDVPDDSIPDFSTDGVPEEETSEPDVGEAVAEIAVTEGGPDEPEVLARSFTDLENLDGASPESAAWAAEVDADADEAPVAEISGDGAAEDEDEATVQIDGIAADAGIAQDEGTDATGEDEMRDAALSEPEAENASPAADEAAELPEHMPEPDVSEPEITEPPATEPLATEPLATEPLAAKPVSLDVEGPAAAEPDTQPEEPAEPEHQVAATTEVEAEPPLDLALAPDEAEAEPVEPETVEPALPETMPFDPDLVESAPAEPEPAEPVQAGLDADDSEDDAPEETAPEAAAESVRPPRRRFFRMPFPTPRAPVVDGRRTEPQTPAAQTAPPEALPAAEGPSASAEPELSAAPSVEFEPEEHESSFTPLPDEAGQQAMEEAIARAAAEEQQAVPVPAGPAPAEGGFEPPDDALIAGAQDEPEQTKPDAAEPEAFEPESEEPVAIEPVAAEPEILEPEVPEFEIQEPEPEPEAPEPEPQEPPKPSTTADPSHPFGKLVAGLRFGPEQPDGTETAAAEDRDGKPGSDARRSGFEPVDDAPPIPSFGPQFEDPIPFEESPEQESPDAAEPLISEPAAAAPARPEPLEEPAAEEMPIAAFMPPEDMPAPAIDWRDAAKPDVPIETAASAAAVAASADAFSDGLVATHQALENDQPLGSKPTSGKPADDPFADVQPVPAAAPAPALPKRLQTARESLRDVAARLSIRDAAIAVEKVKKADVNWPRLGLIAAGLVAVIGVTSLVNSWRQPGDPAPQTVAEAPPAATETQPSESAPTPVSPEVAPADAVAPEPPPASASGEVAGAPAPEAAVPAESATAPTVVEQPVFAAEQALVTLADAPLPNTASPALLRIAQEAVSGDPLRQQDLANVYALGQQIPQNFERAVFWYMRAGENGVINAQFNLAVLTERGLGTQADPAKAIEIYRQVARQGHGPAANALGTAYLEGTAVTRDVEMAAGWFRAAAEAGEARGAMNLGRFYEQGAAGQVDLASAAGWYQRAANMGMSSAATALADLQAANPGIEPQIGQMPSLPADSRLAAPEPEITVDILSMTDLERVGEIQRRLTELGYAPGPVDGLMGGRTRSAIEAFETDIGRRPEGAASNYILAALRLAALQLGVNPGSQ